MFSGSSLVWSSKLVPSHPFPRSVLSFPVPFSRSRFRSLVPRSDLSFPVPFHYSHVPFLRSPFPFSKSLVPLFRYRVSSPRSRVPSPAVPLSCYPLFSFSVPSFLYSVLEFLRSVASFAVAQSPCIQFPAPFLPPFRFRCSPVPTPPPFPRSPRHIIYAGIHHGPSLRRSLTLVWG